MLKANSQKEVSTKLMKGLLDLIILQFLSTQPMHGYQVITKIRKNFGVYFGPSTIIPTPRHPGKERIRRQPMEHEFRTTKKNLQPHNRRTKHAQLHRRLAKPNLQENSHQHSDDTTNQVGMINTKDRSS